MTVVLSAHGDSRDCDVCFGDCGGAGIGGDEGYEKVDPSDSENVGSHIYVSFLV